VPKRAFHAWVVLWIIALAVIGFTLWGLWPKAEAPRPWVAWVSALLGMAVSAFISAVLIKRFGDVARYVKALPPNVA
jgi:tellurite resistance protein TehA-like permease